MRGRKISQEEKQKIIAEVENLAKVEGLSCKDAAYKLGTTLPKYTYYKYGNNRKRTKPSSSPTPRKPKPTLVHIETPPEVPASNLSVVILDGDSLAIERITANLAKAFGR